jgi:hypothetical protein
MPSAKQVFLERGFVGLALASSPFRRVEMAQDEALKFPQAALPSARGGEGASQDDPAEPDDGGEVYTSQATASFARLHKLLAANLGPDDLDTATQLIQQLLSDTSENAAEGGAMAADRRPATPGYSKFFPDAHRLGKQGLTGVTSRSSPSTAADRQGSSNYAARFPNHDRLRRSY